MPFRVEFTELAAERFRNLDEDEERIVRKLREVAANPRRSVSPLRGIGAFKIRVRDYRLIADIDWGEEVVYVLTLGHRSAIYRQ
ncbi:MAG: type II toxin-antitoxin system RelE/ParE family toxin [Candidatus Thermoplasmatota archaeon]|nr:type II toxin-antitoxin system RelE/ParE family toxin [Candidatus Thermoplasmatota archaeon]